MVLRYRLKCLIAAELLIGSSFLVKLIAQEVQLDPIFATVLVSGSNVL